MKSAETWYWNESINTATKAGMIHFIKQIQKDALSHAADLCLHKQFDGGGISDWDMADYPTQQLCRNTILKELP
jgi:hypothetical protein